jgi:hypothetical protein
MGYTMRPVAYVLTKADVVWNRALSDAPGAGAGDRHLRAMAKPYGRIMGSGVSAVMDTCTAEEVQRAGDALEYLGLANLADLTRRLADADWSDDSLDERPVNNAFWGLELALEGAFERKYAESPEDFDPVVDDGVDRPSGSWPSGGQGKAVCAGELIVHEREEVCSRGDACPGITPLVLHSRSRLHSGAGCELCPSGPTWAGRTPAR